MKMIKYGLSLLAITIILATSVVADGEKTEVIMKTSMGYITLELYPEKAPATVENFLNYVDEGFYRGTIFHRVINTFMIQGGGFDVNMAKKETRAPVKNEAANGLKNERGTIAMARTMVPDSATAQFFINTVDNRSLNFRSPSRMGIGYCVFGKVTDGMDVVDKIRAVKTGFKNGMRDVPQENVIIEYIIREAPPEIDTPKVDVPDIYVPEEVSPATPATIEDIPSAI